MKQDPSISEAVSVLWFTGVAGTGSEEIYGKDQKRYMARII